jgi:hypothetical protein
MLEVTKTVLEVTKKIEPDFLCDKSPAIPVFSSNNKTKKIEPDFFCDKSILEDGIEFIGLINKQGRMENAIFNNDISLTGDKKEMYMMGLRLQSSMQSDYDSDFGPVSYTVIEREKSKFVSIVNFPYIILAIMKKSKDHIEVINKIKTTIRNFQNVKEESPTQEK